MSGRLKAEASPLDFYETQEEDVLVLVPHLDKPRRTPFVDLGAGRGAIGRVLHSVWGVRGVAVEFLPQRAAAARASGAYLEVVEGDVSDPAVMRRILELCEGSPELAIGNPPFITWQVFARVADGVLSAEASALLLPAMAWERKKTDAPPYTERSAFIRHKDVGRFDLASRPAFGRKFVDGRGQEEIRVQGEAPSAYAWRMRGPKYAGRWLWLEGSP